jgi:hypothetical protein
MDTNGVEAEAIRRRMDELRGAMHQEVDTVVRSACTLTDWRHYVKRLPWLCLGAAAAAGFLAVPRRVEIIRSDATDLVELAKRNRLVISPNPYPESRGTLAGTVMGLLMNLVTREVATYVGQTLGKAFRGQPVGWPPQQARDR